MKKIFTLIAMAAMAMGANAQVWKVNADTPTAENSTWLDDDFVTITTTFAGTIKEAAATIAGEDFTHYAQVRVDKAPSADALYGTDKGGSTALIITPKQDVTYTIYYRRQAGDWTSNDGKDVKVIDQADPATVLEGEMTIDSKTEDGDYGFATKKISLQAGKTYTVWARGTTLNYYGMKFEAAGGQGGNEGQGGEQGGGSTVSYVATTADGLAPEFAAVVGEGNVATNVVDNNSIVKVELENITLEAVGSATPKEVAKDAINSWNDVKWERKNQGDIDFSYIAGTGVCYTSWAYEEIVRDGEPTGEYRILIGNDDNGWPNFYVTDGSHGLPISGLYYKYTPKVNGTLKMGVWMNKGNRRLFVVPSDTKAAIDYKVEGYINGQNGEDGKKKYLSNDEIRALGSDPYVMGAGNQPFWGYVIVNLEAGKDYYVFSQNAQVGFQGFEFTTGDGTGVREIVAVKNDANAPVYNLAGQRVSPNTKGILIKNGKKFINK